MKEKFTNINNLKLGTPFGYPILTKKRDDLIRELHKRRIFATKLWFNNQYINKNYPIALKFKKEFLAFPLDQRYEATDLDEMKKRINMVLKNKVVKFYSINPNDKLWKDSLSFFSNLSKDIFYSQEFAKLIQNTIYKNNSVKCLVANDGDSYILCPVIERKFEFKKKNIQILHRSII